MLCQITFQDRESLMIIAACIQAAQSVKSHTHIHTKSDFHLEITAVVM